MQSVVSVSEAASGEAYLCCTVLPASPFLLVAGHRQTGGLTCLATSALGCTCHLPGQENHIIHHQTQAAWHFHRAEMHAVFPSNRWQEIYILRPSHSD